MGHREYLHSTDGRVGNLQDKSRKMSYIEDSLAKLTAFEGSVRWMYLDTAGLVTVGVGNMLPDAIAATNLPFHVQTGDDLAGYTEVILEFNRIKAMAAGHSASFYYEQDSPVLFDHDIQDLLKARVFSFEHQLRSIFPEYDSYPDPAKLGLIDMIYNLGLGGLRDGYPKFCMYIKFKNWIAASMQCFRHGPSKERNDWTNQQFELAGATPA